jgi:predicted HicB family RNase H-like nuclease
MEIEETLDKIEEHLEFINRKIDEKVREKENSKIKPLWKKSGKKNSHLNMLIETPLMEQVEKEANKQEISVAEFVRRKLRDDPQLDRIEGKVDSLLKMA